MPGIPRKAVLSNRASYGTGDVLDGAFPLGPLMPYCPYCHRLGLMMAEAGVAFETYLIDSRDKPSWFLEAFPAGTTPAMQGSPGGVDSGEWVGGFDDILARAREQSPRFAQVAHDNGVFKTADIGELCTKLAMSQFAGALAGTERETGKGLLGGIMGMGGIETVEGESGTDTRKRLIATAMECFAKLEGMIASLDGGFVGGDKPSLADAYMATMIFWTHNALESGLSPVPQAPCTLADVGAPSARGYLERWVARPSWKECYKSTSMYSAPTIMAAVKMVVDMAPDVCDGGKTMYEVMARVRRMDALYLEQVDAFSPIFVPLANHEFVQPPGLPAPNVPRIAMLCSRASDGGEASTDGTSPMGPLMPFCSHCLRLCLILAEARVPFELVLIDQANKPRWFTDAYPPAMTPAMQGTPGGVAGGDWVGGFSALLDRATKQSPRVAAVATQRSALTFKEAKSLAERLTSALLGGRAVGSAEPEGRSFARECLERVGLQHEEQQTKSDDELRDVLATAAVATVAEIETYVRASDSFMAGDAPDAADAVMATVLLVAHNLVESGVASVRPSPCSLASLGGPSLLGYLQRWSRRDSWLASYRTRSLNNAAVIRPTVESLVRKAPDVCTAEEMRACMDRARAADHFYREAAEGEKSRLADESRRAMEAAPPPSPPVKENPPAPSLLPGPRPLRRSESGGGSDDGPPPAVLSSASQSKLARLSSSKSLKKKQKSKTNAVICI